METINKNVYSKYCPNVFLAKCPQEYRKGDTITVESKYGKENECTVHNLIYVKDGFFFYSITRSDGFNNQVRAKNRVEKLNNWADSADKRSEEWRGKSQEGKDFLVLAEPIKIGHHSEKRHRALIERNWSRMSNSVAESKKAESYRDRTSYWESMSNKIDLSMPESIEYFEYKVEEAKMKHEGMKNGTIERSHSFSLTYAKKDVNEAEKNLKLAKKLWA